MVNCKWHFDIVSNHSTYCFTFIPNSFSLHLLEPLRYHPWPRQNLLGRLLPPGLPRSSLPRRMLGCSRLYHPIYNHHSVLDHLCLHPDPVVLGQRRQGTMSGCWCDWICKQRISNHAGPDHFDYAHAQLMGFADEEVAQDCGGLHVCSRSIVSTLPY